MVPTDFGKASTPGRSPLSSSSSATPRSTTPTRNDSSKASPSSTSTTSATTPSRSNNAVGGSGSGNPSRVIFDLIAGRKWKAVIEYARSVPGAAEVGNSQRSPSLGAEASSSMPSLPSSSLSASSTSRANLPLHEVCRLQPPLHVVNELLEVYEEAVKVPGRYGLLPLHIACGTGASGEVVTRLMEAYPAATRCRAEEWNESLPIHLAAQCNDTSEDVLMELLTVHPEGSFLQDAHGKTPLDHAHALDESVQPAKQAMINSLETAPILVATAKAAARRVQAEADAKWHGLQQAHQEFVRQLEARQEEEETEFMHLELGFHNALATEKERNCELAQVILNLQRQELHTTQELAALRQQMDQERQSFQMQLEQQRSDIQTALDAGRELAKTVSTKESGDAKGKTGSPTCSSSDEESRSTPSKPTLFDQVSTLATEHQEMSFTIKKTQEELKYNSDMVHHLNQLLSSKDQEIAKLQRELEEKTRQHELAEKELIEVKQTQLDTHQDLLSTKNEMNRLQKRCETQLQQIRESKRQLQIQESRMGSIQSLVESLSYNVQTWKALDEDEDEEARPKPARSSVGRHLRRSSPPQAATTVSQTSSQSTDRSSPHVPRHIQGIDRFKQKQQQRQQQQRSRRASTPTSADQKQVHDDEEEDEFRDGDEEKVASAAKVVAGEQTDQAVGLEVRVLRKTSPKKSSSDETENTALTTKLPDDFDDDDEKEDSEEAKMGGTVAHDDDDMSTLSHLSSPIRGVIQPVDV